MKKLLIIAALALAGCATDTFDIRCPDGNPKQCTQADRAAAAAVGIAAGQLVRSMAPPAFNVNPITGRVTP